MKNIIKKLITLTILLSLLSTLLIGCGRKDDGFDPNAIAFVATYQDIDFGEGHVSSVVSHGDYLYFYTVEWRQEEELSFGKLLKTSIADNTTEEFNLFPLSDNEHITHMVINSQGNFIMLAAKWSEDGGAFYTLYEVSPSGQKIKEVDLNEKLDLGQNNWLQAMKSDAQDNLYISVSTETGTSVVVALSSDLSVKGRAEYNGWMSDLLCTDHGIFVITWSDTGMGMVLKEVDFGTSSFGADIQFEGVGKYGNISFAAGGETGLLISDGSSLFTADIENMTTEKLLDWMDADINADNVRHFGQLENGNFWLMNQVYLQDRTHNELIMLTQTTYGELPKREHITYAALYLGHDIKAAIINFNKTNQKYRIIAKEYINMSEETDWQAAMIQFNTELASGRGADIIDLNNVNFSLLAAKGALYDLTSFINSKDFDKDDYFENVLDAYMFDGKRYGIMTGFAINALVGHETRLKGIDRWNVSEMIEWANGYPDAKLMNTTSTSVMHTLVYSVLDKFIDWDTGKCDFTGEEFLKIMEFAATFGNNTDAWDWGNPDRIGTHEGLTDGHFLLMDQYVYSIEFMQLIDTLFDGEPKFIGYPTESGSGIKLMPSGAVAVNSKSKHKDGAYEFINYLLSDDFQMDSEANRRYSFPVKKSAFDEMIRKATTPLPNSGMFTSSWGYDDIVVELQQDRNIHFVDALMDLIHRADGIRVFDEQINTIIQEETESFFAGQKSARDVAEIIQNRVQVYVNENR